MPDRPLREISRALATSTSPSFPGRMKVTLHCAATARSLWVLQAKAKVESASVKMKPPWAIRWPLTISGLTVIDSVARPDPISTIVMPRLLLASSSFHIASAQARARSSGESVALTFTAVSLSSILPNPHGEEARRAGSNHEATDGPASFETRPDGRSLGGRKAPIRDEEFTHGRNPPPL